MPKGGVKCPDCGYRFKTRRHNPNGTITSDLIQAESRIKGYPPNEQEMAYMCPGKGGKGKHTPHLVKIMRISKGTPQEIVKLKIISLKTADLLDEFTDAWREANRRKYRPDIIFGVAKSR